MLPVSLSAGCRDAAVDWLAFLISQLYLFDAYRMSSVIDCLPSLFTKKVKTTSARVVSLLRKSIAALK